MTSSTYNLFAIALERYYCIVHPIMYKNRVTVRSVKVVCGMVLVLGAVVTIFYTIMLSGLDEYQRCRLQYYWPSEDVKVGLGVFNYTFNFCIPLLVMLCCYLKIILVLKSRVTVAVNPTTSSQSNHGKDDTMTRATKNVFKTLITVTVCYMICWTPGCTLYFYFNLGNSISLFAWYSYLTVILGYLNSCCNPFVYVAQYEQFQKGVRQLGSTIGSRMSGATTSTSIVGITEY